MIKRLKLRFKHLMDRRDARQKPREARETRDRARNRSDEVLEAFRLINRAKGEN